MRALAQRGGFPTSLAQFTPDLAAILRGESVSELPVQQATDFRLVVNLLALGGLGIAPATAIRARADELIE